MVAQLLTGIIGAATCKNTIFQSKKKRLMKTGLDGMIEHPAQQAGFLWKIQVPEG
jgi:hypothetical protein